MPSTTSGITRVVRSDYEKCVWSNHERANSQLRQRCENPIEVTVSTGNRTPG